MSFSNSLTESISQVSDIQYDDENEWDDIQNEDEWSQDQLEYQEEIKFEESNPHRQSINVKTNPLIFHEPAKTNDEKSIVSYNKSVRSIGDSMKKHTGQASIDIVGIIADMIYMDCVYCLCGSTCSKWGKIPWYAMRKDGANQICKHGEFIKGEMYSFEYISKYAFKYQPYYIPLFKKNNTFVGYTCIEDYCKNYSSNVTFWNKNTPLSCLRSIAVTKGRYTKFGGKKDSCHKCRAYRNKKDYMECLFCNFKICKNRCERNLDLDIELGICIYNNNIKRGLLWKQFDIWIDSYFSTKVQVCETCSKDKNPDHIYTIFKDKYPGQDVDISKSEI